MASTFTNNLAIEKPGSGDYSGTWDVPANSNYDVIDQKLGSALSISLAAGSVTLSQSQMRNQTLIFTGTLAADTNVTFPALSSNPAVTLSGGRWTIINQTVATGSSFLVSLRSTGSVFTIAAPPYQAVDAVLLGTGSSEAGAFYYANLPPVGTLYDYFGSALPRWITTGSATPVYLNCDGTTYSASTFPALWVLFGGTLPSTGTFTVPDLRGRFRVPLNQGTGRITAAGGLNADTYFNTGGAQTVTLSSQNIPPVPLTITDPGHTHQISAQSILYTAGGVGANIFGSGVTANTSTATTGITATAGSTSPTAFGAIPPAMAFGFTLIRAG